MGMKCRVAQWPEFVLSRGPKRGPSATFFRATLVAAEPAFAACQHHSMAREARNRDVRFQSIPDMIPAAERIGSGGSPSTTNVEKGPRGPATSLARSTNKRLIEYRELLLGSLQIHRHNVILPTVKDD
jgi:hypothetical protein